MANFADLLGRETSWTYTANGRKCLSSSGEGLVDLFATIGALRNVPDTRRYELFDKACAEDKELAAKILFYGRDIREGLGERNTFRVLLRYAADRYPEIVRPNIGLIGFYGRFDDLYFLIGTKCEDDMWKVMKEQFEKDRASMLAGKPVSLLAKWIKTPDASSPTTRKLGILTSQKLGYKNVRSFKVPLKALRKYLNIVEIAISANELSTIAYDKVPSNAMTKYRTLFSHKDNERFVEYLNDVTSGKKEIKANTLFPYDIVQKYLNAGVNYWSKNFTADGVLEAQWKALPNYVEDGTNVLVMADVSGSMTCNNNLPLASSIGLAMYFAERAAGPFHNKFMTFSSTPKLVSVSGATVCDRVRNMIDADWGMSTDLDAAFRVILETAVNNHVAAKDLPKALVIISDMQINGCVRMGDTFYDCWKKKFAARGYEIPNVIFWNVNSQSNTFHADANRKGVQLLSGHSATTFKTLLANLDKTPYEAMLTTILSDRYAPISVEN